MLSKETAWWITEVVHQLEAVPLAVLVVVSVRRWWTGQRPVGAAFFWLAIAFTVDYVADWVAHRRDPVEVSNIYPLIQMAAMFLALFGVRNPRGVLVLAVFCAALEPHLPTTLGYFVFFRTFSWMLIAAIAWLNRKAEVLPDDRDVPRLPAPLRWSVAITYGIAWPFWMIYLAVTAIYTYPRPAGWVGDWQSWRGGPWATWLPYSLYHLVWMLGAVVYCVAVFRAESLWLAVRSRATQTGQLIAH